MTASREAYQAAMREAHELAWALKWEAASQKYRQALAELPNDATARLSLAVALGKTGQVAEALQECLVVRELLPRDGLVLARIADLHLRLGQHEQAVRACLDLANLHLSQGERVKAASAWRRALEHAAGQRRSLLAIKEAIAEAGAEKLLEQVEEALAQSRPEEPADAAQAMAPTQVPTGREAPPEKAGSPAPSAVAPEAELAPPPARPVPSVTDDAMQRLAAAERHAREGRAAAAVADYLRAAELLGDATAAVAARRAASGLVGDWLVGDLEQAVALPPTERAIVLDAMAASHAHLAQGIHVAALDECLRAVGFGPSYLPAQLRLAEIHRRMGRVDEARERALVVAELYELRGEHRRAAAVLQQQVAVGPEQAAAWQRLVNHLLGTGEVQQAADSLFAWAEQLLSAGETTAALERQREALRLAPRAHRWLRHGSLLETLSQVEEALAAFDATRELAPAEECVAAAQSRCQALLERWPAMEGNLETVLAVLPSDPILGEQVIAQYRAALVRWGESPALHYCLGMALQATGQPEEAVTHLARAAEHDGRPGRLARYHLARWELAAGQMAQAVTRLWSIGEPAAAEDEMDRSLAMASYGLLADTCSRAAHWDGATRALVALLAAEPGDETLYPRLAEAHFKGGRLAAALEALDQLADLYRARKDYDRALAIYRGTMQFAPSDAGPREKLGQLLLRMARREEGLAELKEVVTLQLERGLDEQAAANLLVMLDACRQFDPPQALALRERLVALRPEDVELRRELVAAYMKAGRSVRALAEAQSIVDYLISVGRLEEAAQALQLVIQLDPWNLQEQVRLGNILAELGRAKEALATLERVLARDPANQAARSSVASLRGKRVAEE